MIKHKWIPAVFSLFAIAMIMISAYATDAATNPNAVNSSTKVNTDDATRSDNYAYKDNWTDSGLYNKLNASGVPVRITGYFDSVIGEGFTNTSAEINVGNEWQTWNYTEYNSQQNEDNGYTLGILTGPKPPKPNSNKKVDITAILDTIGQQEAQFDDVQHVTLDGADDASVIDYYGYGDCWADSCWLYNKLSAEGIPVRIMGYKDGGIGDGYRHTWIEINTGNGWQTWNYTKYNSKHAGDNGYGTPFVLIEPGNSPANIGKTGY